MIATWVGGDTTEPTCTEEGFTVYECSVCKDTENFDPIPALGHNYIAVTVDATCTEDGSETTTCSRCDYEDVDVLPALGHGYIVVTVEATCIEDGFGKALALLPKEKDGDAAFLRFIEVLAQNYRLGSNSLAALLQTEAKEVRKRCLLDRQTKDGKRGTALLFPMLLLLLSALILTAAPAFLSM